MSNRAGISNRSHLPPRTRGNLDWQKDAACIDANPTIFFDTKRYADALLVCRECPVTYECGRSRRPGDEGVWGGRVHRRRGW